MCKSLCHFTVTSVCFRENVVCASLLACGQMDSVSLIHCHAGVDDRRFVGDVGLILSLCKGQLCS